MSEDLRDICISCAEMAGERDLNILWDRLGEEIGMSYLLFESDNFVVVPGAGALLPGYTLVIPRDHLLSIGYLPADHDAEFMWVIDGVKRWLAAEFGLEPHIFEHGAKNFREKGGACADHAHTQVVPIGTTDRFIVALQQDFETSPSGAYVESARRTVAQGAGDPYLYTHSDTHGGAIALARGAKSQYFRRYMAEQAGCPDQWDGVMFPFVDNMRRTLDAGQELPTYM